MSTSLPDLRRERRSLQYWQYSRRTNTFYPRPRPLAIVNPRKIPGLIALYDISDLSTLFVERTGASASTPASVDGVVGTVLDLSGNGRHITALSDAARPVLRQAGDIYYLEFDGVDDGLVFPSFEMPTNFWQALAYNTNEDESGVFWSPNISEFNPWTHVFQNLSPDPILTEFSSFDELFVNSVDRRSAVSSRHDIYTEINGKKVTVWKTTTANEADTWVFGAYADPPYNLSGHLYAMVLCDRMSDAERAKIEAWLAEKGGVTL